MDKKIVTVPFESVMVIDGTEYIVHTIFASDTEETVYDKIRRLILNNADALVKENAA